MLEVDLSTETESHEEEMVSDLVVCSVWNE